MSGARINIDQISRLKTVLDGSERIPLRDNIGDLRTTFEAMVDFIVPSVVSNMRQTREIFDMHLENNADDLANDINIYPGFTLDSGYGIILELEAMMTKRLDAAWAVGTNQGGLFSGTKAINTTYGVFSIRKDVDGSIDAGFDIDPDCANIPTGYTAYRRLGFVMTDASGDIIHFLHDWQTKTFRLSPRILTKSAWQVATAGELVYMGVPVGVPVEPLFIFGSGSGSQSSEFTFQIISPDEILYTRVGYTPLRGDFFADVGLYQSGVAQPFIGDSTVHNARRVTNISGEMYFKRSGTYSGSSTYSTLQTLGWIDYTL